MSCNPLSPDAYKYLVRSPLASPGAFRWIRPNTQQDGDIGSVDFVKAPAVLAATKNGAVIHAGTNRLAQNPPLGKWHHVSIEVDGELLLPVAEAEPEAPRVQSRGNKSSLLKARITLAMGTSRVRTFDFDIGAGVEFEVACYAVNMLEVLIPDPNVDPIDLALIVDGNPNPAPPFQLASVLTSTIYFTTGSGRQHNPLTYTVPTLLNAQNTEWIIPRVADSVAITGGTDEFGAAVGGAIIDFIYVPSFEAVAPGMPFVLPGPGGFPPFLLLDQIALPAGSTRFPQTLIPGNANAFRIRRTFAGDDTLINVIQVLNS